MIRAAALATILFSGCHPARTEMVVRIVSGGLSIPTDADAVELFVRNGSDVLFHLPPRPLCGDQPNCLSLPTAVTLFPGPDRPRDVVEVELQALKDGRATIDNAATFTFATGRSQELAFVLYDNCVNTNCAANPVRRSCGASGMCEDLTPAPLGSDLGVPSEDLASPPDLASSAEMSVSSDLAATDLASPHDLAFASDLASTDLAVTPPVFDSASNIGNAAANQITWSHTVGTGSNGILVVAICDYGASNVSGVTWGGSNMTQLFSSNANGFELTVYYFLAPTVGTHDIVASLMTGSQSMAGGSTSFFNVRQQQPTQALLPGSGTDATTSIASSNGNIVLDALATDALPVLTAAGGQTPRNILTAGNGGVACGLGMSTMPGAPTTIMDWTLDQARPWKLGLINLAPP